MQGNAWNHLVERYEAADTEAHVAYLACDDVMGTPEERVADERYDELRRIANEYEDQLLSADAPGRDAALYQLKVFALRFHLVDLDDAPAAGEDVAARMLRRTFTGLAT